MRLFEGPVLWAAELLKPVIDQKIEKVINDTKSSIKQEYSAYVERKNNPNGFCQGTRPI